MERMTKKAVIMLGMKFQSNKHHFQVAEKTALLRPIELKIVPMALEGSAFRSKVLDTDELMDYCGLFAVRIC